MQLNIKIGNKSLVMDPTTKLRFEINSPLFDSEAIQGSYICPFDLPVLGNNIFENAEFIEVNRIYRKYDCIVFLDGLPVYTGELLLNISNPKKYRCSVVLTGIDINFPDRKLNELDYGADINIGGTPHDPNNVISVAEFYNSDSESDFVFPVIHCHDMYGSSDDDADSPANADYGKAITNGGENTGKFINNWNAHDQCFQLNAIRAEDGVTSRDNTFVLVPQFKLAYVVKKIFDSLGYTCIGDFFSDVFISKLLFLNYFAIDEKMKKYYVSTYGDYQQSIANSGRIEFGYGIADEQDEDDCFNFTLSEYTIKTVGYVNVNCIFDAELTTYHPSTLFTIEVHLCDSFSDVVIYTNSGTPISNTYNTFGIYDSYRFYSTDINKRIYILLTYYAGGVFNVHNAKLVIANASYQNLNVYANKIHIANHVTANTVAVVLNAIKKNFGLAMWFDQEKKEVEISFTKDVIDSYHFVDITKMVVKNSMEITSIDAPGYWLTQKSDSEINDITLYKNLGSFVKLTDLPLPDKLNVIAEVLEEGCFYMYKKSETDFSLSWVRYGTSVREVKKGIINDKSTTNNTVALDVVVMTNIVSKDRLLPESNQLGTSAFFETGVNDTDMQILIWHGLVNDKNDRLYPFASSLKYDIAGNVISDIEMRLDGESGIYPNFLKSWYDFMDTAEPVSLQMKLKSTDVISLVKLFKPQDNKANQQIRKVKYNGSTLLPKTFSFIVPIQSGYIEAQIDGYKDGCVIL